MNLDLNLVNHFVTVLGVVLPFNPFDKDSLIFTLRGEGRGGGQEEATEERHKKQRGYKYYNIAGISPCIRSDAMWGAHASWCTWHLQRQSEEI